MVRLLVFLLCLVLSPPVRAAVYTVPSQTITVTGDTTTADGLVVPATQVAGYAWVSVQLYGTWSGTITWEVSNDPTNAGWSPVSLLNMSSTGGGAVSTATANGIYSGPKGSAIWFRGRFSTATSGHVFGAASFSTVSSNWQANSNGAPATSTCTPLTGFLTTSDGNPVTGETSFDPTLSPLSTVAGANGLAAAQQEVHAVAIGNNALKADTTGDKNTAVGFDSLQTATTGGNNACLGYNSCVAVTTASNNTGFGSSACAAATTGGSNICVGYQAGLNNPTTGARNILIGNSLDAPAAGTSDYLSIGGLFKGDISTNLHAYFGGSAPAPSSCGSGAAISAGANDTHGTVTGGSGATGCVVTFANAYTVAPDCVVTTQTAITFAYSVSTTAITVTAASLGTGKFNYVCFGH